MHTWHAYIRTYIILHTCTLHMHILQYAYGHVHINACMHNCVQHDEIVLYTQNYGWVKL